MPGPDPYFVKNDIYHLAEVISTNLTLAVRVIDDYNERVPVFPVTLRIESEGAEAFRNTGGFFCFVNLPAGTYEVHAESDFYFPATQTVDTSTLDPKNPLTELRLMPRPAYPFPFSATLVRGLVNDGAAVSGAAVTVAGKTIETFTDEKGEFVLYFFGIASENITIEITRNGSTKSLNTTIEEGKAISLGVIPFP
ncbi:MAG: carboxypeptidase-like regulatory domain-containing protein [Calditrichia bacterium]